jgi:hypothetical protein
MGYLLKTCILSPVIFSHILQYCHFLLMQLKFDTYNYKCTQTFIEDLFFITTDLCNTFYECVS